MSWQLTSDHEADNSANNSTNKHRPRADKLEHLNLEQKVARIFFSSLQLWVFPSRPPKSIWHQQYFQVQEIPSMLISVGILTLYKNIWFQVSALSRTHNADVILKPWG